MRLVIATPLYPPEIGGPATYARLLEEGLPERGIEIEIVAFSGVRHLPKIVRHYAYYRRVLRAAKTADAVFALDPVSVGLPAMKAAQRAKKPFVVKIVGDYAWEQGQQRFGVTQSLDEFVVSKKTPFIVSVLRNIQIRVALAAIHVIVPSSYLKSVVTNGWGVPAEKIEVIYNAVPVASPGKVPESVSKLQRPFVVSAGRLVPWKRFEGVIDAVMKVPRFSLVIVGDGPERESLHAYARTKGGPAIVFTGQLSHADTLAVMQESDALILNSSYEGLSHVLIEAQSLGIPVIATDAGGNPEVITHGRTGLIIKTNEKEALQKALSDFVSIDRLHMSEAARENSKRFSIETMLSATASSLKNL